MCKILPTVFVVIIGMCFGRDACLDYTKSCSVVLTFEQLEAQPESDPVSDVEPMYMDSRSYLQLQK